jgi:hemin uptake protein HemP
VIYPSAELFAGGQEIWIEHGGDMYRLRITASGKLLLTK